LEVTFLVELVIVLGAALAFSLITWRLGVPTALGQLVAGILIGPFGLRLVTSLTTIEGIAEIGIVLLLFVLGLELDPFQMKEIGVGVFIFSFVEITVSFMFGWFGGVILGWSTYHAFVLGCVVAISSTAIIVKVLQEQKLLKNTFGRMLSGALIVEDMFAIFVLSLLPNLVSGNSPSILDSVWLVARGALLVSVAFIVGTRVIPRLIDKIAHLEFDIYEAGFLLSLSIGLAMAAVAYALGFSAGTGAFLMGFFTLGKRAKFILGKILPVRDLFIVIFFVSMGMLIDPSALLNPTLTLPIVGLAIAGKFLGSYLGGILSRHRDIARDMALGMNPRGEFSFIIAREASSSNITGGIIYPAASIVVLFTCLISGILQVFKSKKTHSAVNVDGDRNLT
jgi:CPA2 family monovalent cation:H+ antiporter-2